MDLNLSVLIGRLASDVKYFPSTKSTSSRITGRLTINRPPNSSGKRGSDTIPIVAWGPHADNFAKYTSRGKELCIVGEHRINSEAPKRPGEKWKNFSEVLVRYVSFGHDSNKQKMMKALNSGINLFSLIGGERGEDHGAEAEEGIAAMLHQNPALKEKLLAIARQGGEETKLTPSNGVGASAKPPVKVDESPFGE